MIIRQLIVVFCVMVSTWQYVVMSLEETAESLHPWLTGLLAGTIDAPFVYRPLTPAVIVALGNTPPVFIAFQFVMLYIFFMLLWGWIEHWGGIPAVGVALATVALSVMWPTYFYSVYTVTEWVLWLIGLHMLVRSPKPLAYALLVAVAATNREMTAVLLVCSWFALQPRQWRWGLVYVAIGLAVYGVIRWLVGDVESRYTLQYVFVHNVYSPQTVPGLVLNALLLPLWIACVVSWRRAPYHLRRLFVVVSVVYLPLWLAFALWQEVRLLMPIVILALPMICSARYLLPSRQLTESGQA